MDRITQFPDVITGMQFHFSLEPVRRTGYNAPSVGAILSETKSPIRQPESAPTHVRWLILGLLFAISVVTYIDRVNISVTARQSYILRVRELAKACGAAWLKTDGGQP